MSRVWNLESSEVVQKTKNYTRSELYEESKIGGKIVNQIKTKQNII